MRSLFSPIYIYIYIYIYIWQTLLGGGPAVAPEVLEALISAEEEKIEARLLGAVDIDAHISEALRCSVYLLYKYKSTNTDTVWGGGYRCAYF